MVLRKMHNIEVTLLVFSVVKNLTDVFYLCIIMMAYGPPFVKATIHGIVLNTVQSLASLPEVMANGKFTY